MVDFKDFLPVMGVAVGWALNEMGQQLRGRREDRKAIARALAELLEINHRVSSFIDFLELLEKRLGPLPPQLRHAVFTMLEGMVGTGEDLKKRYDEAVTLVSSVDPILGFRLRSQDDYPRFIAKLRAIASKSPQASLNPDIESILNKQLQKSLKEITLDLAWHHGLTTWFKAKKRLGRRFEVPAEMEQIFQQLSQIQASFGGMNNLSVPEDLLSMFTQSASTAPKE